MTSEVILVVRLGNKDLITGLTSKRPLTLRNITKVVVFDVVSGFEGFHAGIALVFDRVS